MDKVRDIAARNRRSCGQPQCLGVAPVAAACVDAQGCGAAGAAFAFTCGQHVEGGRVVGVQRGGKAAPLNVVGQTESGGG